MRIDASPRHRNAPPPEGKRCRAFLQWLRGRKCLIGGTCAGRIEAAHVGTTGKGMGTKCADAEAVPLCSQHHGEQHMAGIETFQRRHNVNLEACAKEYWRRWPGRHAWEAKQP